MLLLLHNNRILWITFLLPLFYPILGTLPFLLQTYLKLDLYGFHSYIFSNFCTFLFSEISTNLFTLYTMLSTIHCNKQKASRKERAFLPLLACVNLSLKFSSYPQLINFIVKSYLLKLILTQLTFLDDRL